MGFIRLGFWDFWDPEVGFWDLPSTMDFWDSPGCVFVTLPSGILGFFQVRFWDSSGWFLGFPGWDFGISPGGFLESPPPPSPKDFWDSSERFWDSQVGF